MSRATAAQVCSYVPIIGIKTPCSAPLPEVVERLGHLDVLVNNAGQHRLARSLEQTQPHWEDLLHRNLSGTFYFVQAAAKSMREVGGGHIVNISSKMATSTAPSNAAYCAAKAGVVALTQVLAIQNPGELCGARNHGD
jgi:3-hydroxybutyrate dehydrogenase